MKTPQFLYIPRLTATSPEKLIHETRIGIYWQVLEFDDRAAQAEWLADNEGNIQAAAVNMHTKYPIVLLCIGITGQVTNDRLVKLGNLACDWYIQFWLRNKQLTRPSFDEDDSSLDKAAKHYTHWVWGENELSDPDHTTLVNLEHGISIRFPYGESFFATFEDWEAEIADIQYLSGHRPSPDEVERHLTDAWNFMGIIERLEDGFGLDDIEDDIF